MAASSTAFRYPLPPQALPLFCHPHEGHTLHQPVRIGKEIVAGNGYLAIRCHRGYWLDSDYPEAPADYAARIEKLPWSRIPAGEEADVSLLSDYRGDIYRHAPIAVWDKAGRISASPIWKIGDVPLRLSFIQLIARLPRIEVFTGPSSRTCPLFFRFSGGSGIVAREPALDAPAAPRPARTLFGAQHCRLSGQRLQPQKGSRPNFSPSNSTWPPPEPVD